MRTVLIAGADFAPSSLPPALRIRFFANHLADCGWKPIVLTTKPEYYEHEVDPENEKLIRPSVEIIRTKAFPARITRRIGIGDIGMRSLWQHWRAIKRLATERRIDALLIPVPPFVPMVLGRRAWSRFRIPYVIDFIDPWVTEFYRSVPRSQRPPKWFFADRLARCVEPYALRHVAHLAGVSRGTTGSLLARYPWLSPEMTSEIPYGGEPGDFDYLRAHPRPNPLFDQGDGLFHMCSVGRGGPDQQPILSAVFSAVHLGLEREPELFGKLRLHFAGTTYSPRPDTGFQVTPLAAQFGLERFVTEHPGRVPYLTALQLMLDSQALLAIGSTSVHYTASKIFPYLLAQRPLVAIFHESSSVVQILAEAKTGSVFTFRDGRPPGGHVPALSSTLGQLLRARPDAGSPAAPGAMDGYSADAMTRRLAVALELAAATAGAASGNVRRAHAGSIWPGHSS